MMFGVRRPNSFRPLERQRHAPPLTLGESEKGALFSYPEALFNDRDRSAAFARASDPCRREAAVHIERIGTEIESCRRDRSCF